MAISSPLETGGNQLVAFGWSNLWDGQLENSLWPILSSSVWWFGSFADGTIDTTCLGWSGTLGTGRFGWRSHMDNAWVAASRYLCDNTDPQVVCICW